MGFDYTVSGKDKGLTYIFLEQAKKQAGFDGTKKIDWNAVMSVFDQIQKEEEAEGQNLFRGGTDKTRAGWGKSYQIRQGDKISLSDEQMNKIYGAMGLTLSKPDAQEEVSQQAAPQAPAQISEQTPPQTTSQPAPQTSAQQSAQTEQQAPTQAPSQTEHTAEAQSTAAMLGAATDAQAENVTEKQKQDFNNVVAGFKTPDKTPDAEYLKSGGFGTAENSKKMRDENGLYYTLDKNGGRTYTNSNGESIRISSFEARFVDKDAVSVTYSAGGNSNSIVYGKDGKPIQGTLIDNKDGNVYMYKYEAGKPVLQSVQSMPRFENDEPMQQTPTPAKVPENFYDLSTNALLNFFNKDKYNKIDLKPYSSIEQNMSENKNQEAERSYSDFWDNNAITTVITLAGTFYEKGRFTVNSQDEFENIKPLAKIVCNMLVSGKDKYIELLQGEPDFRAFASAGKRNSVSKEDWAFMVRYGDMMSRMGFELDKNGAIVKNPKG